MNSHNNIEDFCTIFDSSFLVLGLAMYRSLKRHCSNARLWILAMDDSAAQTLKELALEDVIVIPVSELETETLRDLKKTRTNGEYCWTLSPYFPWWLITNSRVDKRVTYVDADLFFFSNPQKIFDELETANKSVLITEHAYDPQYDQTATSGRFCVQFMTFCATSAGMKVLEWWKDRCIEWCFARFEDGKFGDQKYLDCWPERFKEEVHVLTDRFLALAPWNAEIAFENYPQLLPVFYHYHGLRFIGEKRVRLHRSYKISKNTIKKIYTPYVDELRSIKTELSKFETNIPRLPERSFLQLLKEFRLIASGRQTEIKFK